MESTAKTSRRLIVAAALAALAVASAPASADMETLLDKLHEKGVLSDDDYQQMRTEARADRRAEALKNATEEEKEQKAKSASASTLKVPEALKSMDAHDREVLILRHFEELSSTGGGPDPGNQAVGDREALRKVLVAY